MSIECYHSECSHHSAHTDRDLGPYCDERECVASRADLAVFQVHRYGHRACDNPKCSFNTLPFAKGGATVTVAVPGTLAKKEVKRYEYRLENNETVYFCEACHNVAQMVMPLVL